MAAGTEIEYGKIYLAFSDEASSPTWSAPCGLTEVSSSTAVETSQETMPDCDDPDGALGIVITKEISRTTSFSFSGMLPKEAFKFWKGWNETGGEKTMREVYNLTLAEGGGHDEGRAILTGFEKKGTYKNMWKVSGTIVWAKPPTWTDASA